MPIMKPYLIFSLLFLLASCGGKGTGEVESPESPGLDPEGNFTQEVLNYIQAVSDIDCQLHILFVQAISAGQGDQDSVKFMELRAKKRALIDSILSINRDSAFVTAVHGELNRLKEQEGYCAEASELQGKTSESDKLGVPKQTLHIREDAEKLGKLNCRIIKVSQQFEADPKNEKARLELRSLQQRKRTMLNQLILLYGHDLIRDVAFRQMVVEVQEKNCNYTKELKAHHRYSDFAL